MEVALPPSPLIIDFNLDTACSSPYISAPTSPIKDQHDTSLFTHNPFFTSSSSSTIPFQWEEKPGTPKAKTNIRAEDNGGDFEFYFSGQRLDRISSSAEEMFDKGKIRPLKPPPGHDFSSQRSSPRTPNKKTDSGFDPFQAALEETGRREVGQERGRERTTSIRKKVTSRSLSPLRLFDIIVSEAEDSKQKGHKKWKLKDLLLFRGASEGRPSSGSSATRGIIRSGKGDISSGKYLVLSNKEMTEDVKNSSFRSTEGSVSRRRISSEEARYTANRAVLEDMRRKTSLPCKQGLLGRLFIRFQPFQSRRG